VIKACIKIAGQYDKFGNLVTLILVVSGIWSFYNIRYDAIVRHLNDLSLDGILFKAIFQFWCYFEMYDPKTKKFKFH